MADIVTTSGLVATDVRHTVTSEGLAITSFRLASSQRRYNKSSGTWEYGETNWFTVSAFRQLAINAAASITKGDRIVVTGRLRIRQWGNGERTGTVVAIDADAIGHDLNWGKATFTRSVKSNVDGAGESRREEKPEGAHAVFDPDAASEHPEPDSGGWASGPGDLVAV